MLQAHKLQGVEQWPIERLMPYAKNARVHSPEQIGTIAKSVDQFGFVGAVVVRDGVLAKGHGTLEAVRQLYGKGKAVYPAPGAAAGAVAFPAGTIPVFEVHGWTDAQFRAYVLTDNQSAIGGASWDQDLLAFELDELRDAEFDLSTIGFAPGELNDLIGTPNTGFDTSPQLTDGFKFSVMVACADEAEQARMLERFEAEGLTCRPLITQ